MKAFMVMTAACLIMLISTSFAQFSNEKYEKTFTKNAIANLLVGIHSDNYGLRLSCAYYLGEYHITEGIIPLMEMLKTENTEEARIIAALSLSKIGTDKALFAVRQAGIFDRSERVRNLCNLFYANSPIVKNMESDIVL